MGIIINGQNDTIGPVDNSMSLLGTVSIGGTMTIEDFTNIDSVGLITARNGLQVTGGNVAIGHNNPSAPLHLSGADANAAKIKIEDNNNGFAASEINVANGGRDLRIAAPQDIYFQDVDTGEKHLYIESGGNIGIGTDNPLVKTHVIGASSGGGKLFIDTIGTFSGTDTSTLGFSVFRGGNNVRSNSQAEIECVGDGNYSGSLVFKIQNPGTYPNSLVERLRIDSSGRLLKSGQAALTSTSLSHPIQVASASDANAIAIFGRAADDIGELSFYEADKSTKLGELQYRQDHVNFRCRVGDIRFASGGTSETLRIDGSGRIAQGGRTPTNHGSPNLLLWGSDTTLHLTSTGSVNNSSFTGIKFAVAGGSTGDYSKAGIFVQRQDSYNDLDMIFAFRSSNDAAGVAISDEKLRINSDGKLTVTPTDTTSSYATTDGGIDIAQTISSTGTSDSQSIGIQFNLTKSGQTGAIAEIGAIRQGSGLSGLVFRTRDNSTGRNERLRITSAGFVGINEGDPEVRFHVYENTGDGSSRTLAMFQKNHTSTSISGNMASNGYPHALILENQDNSSDQGLSSLCFSKYTSGSQSQAVIAGISESAGNMALTFNTERSNTVGERLRITSSGAVNLSTPSSSVAAGLLNVPNGSRVTTTSGVYVTGNGGIVDMARYEMINKCITAFPANNNAICAINGAPLYIDDARNAWAVYSGLPNYLLGTLTHDCINNSSFTVTLACTMTVFLGRSSTWNAVSLTGWNLIESNTGIAPFSSNTRLYVKTLAAGTHTLDNDSAMYFFSL